MATDWTDRLVPKPAEDDFFWITCKGAKAPKPPAVSPPKKKAGARSLQQRQQQQSLDAPIKLPGRHRCDCEATEHPLINNCEQCGRIVCEQEGSGPCLFCDRLVCTNEEQMVLDRNTKKSDELMRKLKHGGGGDRQGPPPSFASIGEQLNSAVAQRDKLLDFDADSERRTKVIDDQTDYYSAESNPFLSVEQRQALNRRRQELLAKKFGPRAGKAHVVSLDFLGRKVTEAPEEAIDFDNDPVIQAILANPQPTSSSLGGGGGSRVLPPSLSNPPVYDESVGNSRSQPRRAGTGGLSGRLQGAAFVEVAADAGVCLSISQPFASLLVAGIKQHEGRNWYMEHRGRLWIASTAKQVDKTEIARIEHFYRSLLSAEAAPLSFPIQYKSGALLGCVTVVDCLPLEQYRLQYPNGEMDDPYVIICEQHQQLPVHFPVRGQAKLYHLDQNILQAAQKMLT